MNWFWNKCKETQNGQKKPSFIFPGTDLLEPTTNRGAATLPEFEDMRTEKVGGGSLDISSDTWAFIKSYCEKQLVRLRESNDNTTLDDKKTLIIRGQIKQLKEVLELSKPKPEIPDVQYPEDC